MLKPMISPTRQCREIGTTWTWALETPHRPVNVGKPRAPEKTVALPGVLNDGCIPDIPEDFAGVVSLETLFTVEEADKAQRLVLRFESVVHHCQVFLNGQPAFMNRGGYLPFEGAVNDLVQVGENRLTLRLANLLDPGTLPAGSYEPVEDKPGGFQNNRYVSHPDPMGILGPVYLYTTPWFYIERLTSAVQRCGDTTSLAVQAKTVGPCDSLHWSIRDPQGKPVARGTGRSTELEIPDPQIWGLQNPSCYTLRAETMEGESLQDVVSQPFAIRTEAAEEQTYQHWPAEELGLAWTPQAGERLAAYWRQCPEKTTLHLGAYPALPEVLETADRMGIPLITGVFPGNPAQWPEEAQRQEALEARLASWRTMALGLVQRDAHHPSVTAWSLGPFPMEAPSFWQAQAEALAESVTEADPEHRPVIWT